MVHNDATPKIEIDPETYEVKVDGEIATVDSCYRSITRTFV